MSRLPLLALVALSSALVVGCSGPTYPGGEIACAEQMKIQVLEAKDGDTIVVEYLDGPRATGTDDVRLIGLDTPEIDHDGGDDHDCFGLPAWQETIDLLVGETAYITFDTECSDTYGRALGYVFRESDGLFVNLYLVRQGFGRACPFSTSTTFSADFAEAESGAIEEDLGRPALGR